MAGYIPRRFTCPRTVTHPSSNRAQCQLTALIELNALTTDASFKHSSLSVDMHVCMYVAMTVSLRQYISETKGDSGLQAYRKVPNGRRIVT